MTDTHNSSSNNNKFRYRTIDLVVTVMVGVAFGVAFFGYSNVYTLLTPVTKIFPPVEGLLTGFWCLPALVAMLIVRKPGAALGAEVLAACIEMLLGSHFAFGAVISGLLQGAGFEIAFATASWASAGWGVVFLGSLLSTFFEWVYEINAYYPDWSMVHKIFLLGFFWVSALTLLAGLGMLIVRALARTGAINQFAPGREYTYTNAA